jgi:diadenosine tetraphosphate (Ap4A) HIT family hydrolase
MLYKDLLKKNKSCPFCERKTNQIIIKGEKAFLTYNLVPYNKHHILIIPYRHTKDFDDLTKAELDSINKLLHTGVRLLNTLGYNKDYSILLRNGDNSIKTIEHLHYHIIPTIPIGRMNSDGKERVVMTKKEINQTLKDFENAKLLIKN